MATPCKRLLTTHSHCKRLRSFVKHQVLSVKAQAQKQEAQSIKKNTQKEVKKAKTSRKSFDNRPKRTIVLKYLQSITNWKKNYTENKFFKYRVMSRRYLRKLSLSEIPRKNEQQRRRISWGNEVEVLIFNEEDEVNTISQATKIKQVLEEILL